ncbi:MAG TPA: Hsp70 family protein [Actinocatenispora sp.]
MAGFLLGVDLGTSNTVAVLRRPDGRTRALLFDGAELLPSAVFVDPGGVCWVGRDAVRGARTDPARYEPNPKRRIDERTVLLGAAVPTVDLLAAVLRRVADEAVRVAGELPPAVLTHPADWDAPRREALAAAAANAGLTVAALLPEPVAAAAYFATVPGPALPAGGALAVLDAGAGTTDAAVVRADPGGYRVLATGGLPDLGGLDLDAALVERIGAVLSPAADAVPSWSRLSAPSSPDEYRDRWLFWDDVRGAKEALSRLSSVPVHVPGAAALHLTRTEFEEVARPRLAPAVDLMADVIARAGLTPARLAGVFLVGGGSRVPMIAGLLHERLGIAPMVLEQPELVVAEGALHVPLSASAGAGAPAVEAVLPGQRSAAGARPDDRPAPGSPDAGPTSGAPAAFSTAGAEPPPASGAGAVPAPEPASGAGAGPGPAFGVGAEPAAGPPASPEGGWAGPSTSGPPAGYTPAHPWGDGTGVPARRGVRVGYLVVVLVLAVLLLAAGGATAVVGVDRLTAPAPSWPDASARAATAAAKKAVPDVLGYDYRHLDHDIAAGRDWCTGPMRTTYVTNMGTLQGRIMDNKVVVVATVRDVGVVSTGTGTVTLLASVDQQRSNASTTGEMLDRNRVRLVMRRTSGRWLVATLEAL